MRDVSVKILQRLGYAVLAAKDGAEALKIADARLDDIDLLLTDVVIPRISGKELVKRIYVKGRMVTLVVKG